MCIYIYLVVVLYIYIYDYLGPRFLTDIPWQYIYVWTYKAIISPHIHF